MERSGFVIVCCALGVAGALGGCFDKGVIAANVGGGDAAQGGLGGIGGGTGGAGGIGGADEVTSASSSGGGGGECVPCYEGPPGTRDVGACKSGCLQDGECDDVRPKAERCATADDENCDEEPSCTGTHEWSIRIGENGENGDKEGLGVAFDGEGNILVAGSFTGALGSTASLGSNDGFITKLNPSGDTHANWPRAFGGPGTDRCSVVARDSGNNVIMAGTFDGDANIGGMSFHSQGTTDVFVAKLDPQGNVLWVASISGVNQELVNGIAVDSEDNIVVAGEIGSTATLRDSMARTTRMMGQGGGDIFVVKLNGAGGLLWDSHFGNTSPQAALDVAITPDNDVVVVGRSTGTVDFGRFALSATDQDAFVAKLDATTGEPSWAKIFGGSMEQEFAGVATDREGNIVVGGSTRGVINFDGLSSAYAGGLDAVVAAFGADGRHLWNHSYGDAEDQKVLGVAADQAGNVLLVGEFESSLNILAPPLASRGGLDAFLAKLDPAGKTVWAKSFGRDMDQRATAVDVDALGTIVFTGMFSGSIDLGGGLMTSQAGHDAFVAKLQP
ncbi:SBBP repeat-containing protein [Sorangium sp. So ce388]|uniref:SBBP repeat-containing protein n=1 Tax=Sorangium sp. So ce388 TaxID=3133309 RepID=UPI003F5BAAFB